MIAGNEAPQRPEDSETQLARIGHRLARLYQIMQENRRRVDEERQELQTLVSDISHQVKTPISNLKMATDTLLEKPMTEAERTDFIRGIRSQTDKLDFLFQALVKTSRLETGVIQLDKKPGRLFDTVAQAMSGIVYAAEKKEIAVSVDCPEDLTVFHDSKWTSAIRPPSSGHFRKQSGYIAIFHYVADALTGENTMKKIFFATTIILIINVILSIVLFFVG